MHPLLIFHAKFSKIRFLHIILCCICLCSCNTTVLPNPKSTPVNVPQAGTWLHHYSDQLFATAIAWSPDGKRVAVLGSKVFNKYIIQVWNLLSGKKEVTYQVGSFVSNGPVLAWSPDGQQIASAGDVIHIWNATTGQTQESIASSAIGFPFISAIAWSPDGTRIALAGYPTQGHDQVLVWDIRTSHVIWKVDLQSHVREVEWSRNGQWLAVATDIAVQLRAPGTGQLLHSYSGYIGVVMSISWSPDSIYLASSESGGTVRLQNISGGQATTFYSSNGAGPVVFVVWSPKGKYLAFSTIDDTVHIWNILKKRSIAVCSTGGKNSVLALTWSPDGTMIAAVDTSISEGFEICRAIP